MTALTEAVAAAAGVPVGVGKPPAGLGAGQPYAVIWPSVPMRSTPTMRLDGGYTETWVCHCYGETEAAAAFVLGKLTAAVYGLHLTTVDGRVVQYPEQLSAVPLAVDRDATPDLYDLAVEWRLRTSPTERGQ